MNFDDLFPEDHPVPRILKLVQELDLSEFDNSYANDTCRGGRAALPPDRILAILFYSILYGNISMRNLERDSKQRADLMYLSGGLEFDHSSISVFRKRHSEAIKKLFIQTVFLGVEAGMINLDVVCGDSTKIKASANRRDIGTQEELEKRYRYMENLCKKRYEDWKNLEGIEEKRVQEKKLKKLEQQKEKIACGIEFLKSRCEKKRVHLTDSDADWRKDGSNHFIVGYSVQTAVDSKSQMIVHSEVVQTAEDSSETVPLVQAVEEIKKAVMPKSPGETRYVMDAGYASEANLSVLKDKDLYIPDREYARFIGGKTKPENRTALKKRKTTRFKYDQVNDRFLCHVKKDIPFRREYEYRGKKYREYIRYACGNCQHRENCKHDHKHGVRVKVLAGNLDGLDEKSSHFPGGKFSRAMRMKLESPEGRSIYARRFPVIESVFGIIKEVRNGRQFLRRGLLNVREEWKERCIAHNLAVLIKFSRVALT